MDKNNKNSFLLYCEQIELVNELSDEQAGELFKKIYQYVATGVIPDLSGITKMAFIAIRQDLDRNSEKYEKIVEARRIAGAKGGRGHKANKIESSATTTIKQKQVNEQVNLKDVIPTQETISDDDRLILENFIKKNKLASKNIKAYARKLISNGDWKKIIDDEKIRIEQLQLEKLSEKERIKNELASIHDKRSCARVLVNYYQSGAPPDEFDDVMKKYNLDSYRKMEEYAYELHRFGKSS